jgi:hypothetical protein
MYKRSLRVSEIDLSGLRDLKTTTMQQLSALTFAHQEMQDSLLAAAEGVGATVRRRKATIVDAVRQLLIQKKLIEDRKLLY